MEKCSPNYPLLPLSDPMGKMGWGNNIDIAAAKVVRGAKGRSPWGLLTWWDSDSDGKNSMVGDQAVVQNCRGSDYSNEREEKTVECPS